MKNLKFTFLILSFVLIGAVSASSQNKISETKRNLIAEIIILTKTDKQILEITDTILASTENSFQISFDRSVDQRTDLTTAEKQLLKAASKEKYQAFSRKFRERLPKAINYAKYIEDTIYPLYDKFFTESELRNLVSFYKTPTGQKVIETMPQLFREMSRLSEKTLLPDILKLLDEILKEELEDIGKTTNK